MDYQAPRHVVDLVASVASDYAHDSIANGVREAFKRVKKLPDYKQIVDEMVFIAVQELYYRYRVQVTRQTKQRIMNPPKVGLSSTINKLEAEAADAYNQWYIGTKLLGDLKGCELQGIADEERLKGNGHFINSRLLGWLAELVPADKMVREVVPAKKIEAKYKRIKKEVQEVW